MSTAKPTLDLLPGDFAVCRLPPESDLPAWANTGNVVSITRTPDELSVVCDAVAVPAAVTHSTGWRAFKVLGPLDFALVGILAGLSTALAEAGVSVFAISTYDTDYLLVQEAQLETAVAALTAAGYPVT